MPEVYSFVMLMVFHQFKQVRTFFVGGRNEESTLQKEIFPVWQRGALLVCQQQCDGPTVAVVWSMTEVTATV